jgi:phage gp46-like protein
MRDITIGFVDGRPEVTLGVSDSLRNNVYLSLLVRQGSWWHAPEFGSRLYQIRKVSEDTLALAGDYCKEALTWLTAAGRAKEVAVEVERDPQSGDRINIAVTVTRANDEVETLTLFYPVV